MTTATLTLFLCLGWAFVVNAQSFSLGVKVPIELQTIAAKNLYNNVEIAGAMRIGELLQVETSLLIPVAPLFVSVTGAFTFLRASSDQLQQSLDLYLGAGLIYISVGPQSFWGFQGLGGLQWHLPNVPFSLVLEAGAKAFNFFIDTFSGPFVNLGVRLNF